MRIAKQLLEQARRLQEKATTAVEGARMGVALWCDEGNHAFSEKADSMTGTRKSTKGGVVTVEDYLICADCMSRKTNVPAIENVPVVQDAYPQAMSDGNYASPQMQTGTLYGQ